MRDLIRATDGCPCRTLRGLAFVVLLTKKRESNDSATGELRAKSVSALITFPFFVLAFLSPFFFFFFSPSPLPHAERMRHDLHSFTFIEFDCHQDDTRAPSRTCQFEAEGKEIGGDLDSRMGDAWMQSTGTPSDDCPTKQTYEISRVLN